MAFMQSGNSSQLILNILVYDTIYFVCNSILRVYAASIFKVQAHYSKTSVVSALLVQQAQALYLMLVTVTNWLHCFLPERVLGFNVWSAE